MTSTAHTLELQVLLPTHELLTTPVTKVIAEADNGEFCVLPKHTDFVATLVPSILTYWTRQRDGSQAVNYAAINHGVFVKYADTITISVLDGVCSNDLEQLQSEVDRHFLERTRPFRSGQRHLSSAGL